MLLVGYSFLTSFFTIESENADTCFSSFPYSWEFMWPSFGRWDIKENPLGVLRKESPPLQSKQKREVWEENFLSLLVEVKLNMKTRTQDGKMEGGKGLGSDDTARPLNQPIGPATLYMLRKYGGKKKKESEKQPCGLSHCWWDGFSITCSLVYPYWYIHIYRAVESERKCGCEAQSSSAVNICMAIIM